MLVKIYWSFCFGLLLFGCRYSTTSVAKPLLELNKLQLDFGRVQGMDTLRQELILKNKGTAPLTIENIQASCGCMIPQWSDASILPGQQQKIEVALVPAEIGEPGEEAQEFVKTLVIRSNIDSMFTVLQVVGTMVKTL